MKSCWPHTLYLQQLIWPFSVQCSLPSPITPTTQFPPTMRLLDIKACLRTGHFLVRSYPSLGNRISFQLSDKPSTSRRSSPLPRPLCHLSFEVVALTCKFPTLWLAKGPLMRLGNEYWKRSRWLLAGPAM